MRASSMYACMLRRLNLGLALSDKSTVTTTLTINALSALTWLRCIFPQNCNIGSFVCQLPTYREQMLRTSAMLLCVHHSLFEDAEVLIVITQNYDFPNNLEDYVHRIGRTGVSVSPISRYFLGKG